MNTNSSTEGVPAHTKSELFDSDMLNATIGRLSCRHGLSPAQTRVFAQLCSGLDVQEIAYSLCLSEHTVRNHIKAVLKKAGESSQRKLIQLFVRELDGAASENWRALYPSRSEDLRPRTSPGEENDFCSSEFYSE